ncbi:MAG TPA: ice-binding family protein [Microthrixaceae bacterium]|nr:ice-binding family protein [Microthrixaceae bacterium]
MPRTRTSHASTNAPRRHRSARPRLALVGVAVVAPTLWFALPAAAAVAPIGLGTASSFSVLAGAGITNTGPTTMWGDAGTFATTSESGFGTVTILGTNHGGDAVTQQAKNDLTTAYNQAAASAPPTNVADELGGLTLTPGVYDGAALQLTGTLTLDTLGDPNAVFVFRTGSTLITASSSDVIVLGGGVACNVFWQVPSSATLGTASHLIGTVMASTSITANTGATIVGRLLASTGAVTLDSNTLTNTGCADSTMSTTTSTTTSTTPPTTAPPTTAAAVPTSSTTPTGSSTPTTTPGDITQGERPPLAFTGPGRSVPFAVTAGVSLFVGTAALRIRRHRLRAAGSPGSA